MVGIYFLDRPDGWVGPWFGTYAEWVEIISTKTGLTLYGAEYVPNVVQCYVAEGQSWTNANKAAAFDQVNTLLMSLV